MTRSNFSTMTTAIFRKKDSKIFLLVSQEDKDTIFVSYIGHICPRIISEPQLRPVLVAKAIRTLFPSATCAIWAPLSSWAVDPRMKAHAQQFLSNLGLKITRIDLSPSAPIGDRWLLPSFLSVKLTTDLLMMGWLLL